MGLMVADAATVASATKGTESGKLENKDEGAMDESRDEKKDVLERKGKKKDGDSSSERNKELQTPDRASKRKGVPHDDDAEDAATSRSKAQRELVAQASMDTPPTKTR